MGKFVFLLLLTAHVCASAQKVIVDRAVGKYRFIETSSITARHFTDHVVWNFGLRGYFDTETDSAAYVLVINLNAMHPISYPKGTTLLIKNMEDEVVELRSMNEYKGNSVLLGYTTYAPVVGNVGTATANVVTRNIAEFVITPQEMEKLKPGVKKVRVQTTDGYLENECKRTSAGHSCASRLN